MSSSVYIAPKLLQYETTSESEFYKTCQVGDTSNYSPYRQGCGILVSGLLYCTRAEGHVDDRHVAEGLTNVLAVSK